MSVLFQITSVIYYDIPNHILKYSHQFLFKTFTIISRLSILLPFTTPSPKMNPLKLFINFVFNILIKEYRPE